MFDFLILTFLIQIKNRIFIMLMRDGLEMVPARSHKPFYAGLNSAPTTNKYGLVDQSVLDHLTHNQQVGCPILLQGRDGSETILADPVGTVPGRRRQCLNTKGRCNYCVNSKSPPADAVI